MLLVRSKCANQEVIMRGGEPFALQEASDYRPRHFGVTVGDSPSAV